MINAIIPVFIDRNDDESNDRKIDFRVSSMPAYYGEKIVMRILDSEKGIYKLNPNDSIFLFGERGKLGNYLPFNSVKINKEHDSLIITNTNLVDNINNEKGSKYYIIIK